MAVYNEPGAVSVQCEGLSINEDRATLSHRRVSVLGICEVGIHLETAKRGDAGICRNKSVIGRCCRSDQTTDSLPGCRRVLETRTGSLTGKNFGLQPWRTRILICGVGRFRPSAFRKKVR